MLSEFITPWQKPLVCQAAIMRAVRPTTSRSKAATGSAASRHCG